MDKKDEGHSMPGTIDVLVDDLSRGLKTPEHFAHELRGFHIPLDKDGKVDYIHLIREISEKGKGYATHNKTDPLQSTPTDIDIKSLLESDGVVEDGHFTQAGVNQIVGLYTQGATNYAQTRLQSGMLRSSVEADRADGKRLAAGTGNFEAIREIEKAKDQEGVLRAVGTSIREVMEKAGAASARGKLKQYIDGLKDYMSGSGHGAPAYAGGH